MYIAVTAEGDRLTDGVSQSFDSCKYLLIVNMDDLSINAIENKDSVSKEQLAQKVVDFDCEAIITGDIDPAAFDILADAYITRYFGYGNSAKKALDLMEKNSLKLIKSVEGAKGNCKHANNF